MDPYQVLGIPNGASLDEAAAAHRRLAAIYHPDRYASSPTDVRGEAARRMSEVNAAFSELKAAHDAPQPASAPSQPQREASAGVGSEYTGDACDICGSAPTALITLK